MDGTKSFPEFKCKIVLSLVPTKNYNVHIFNDMQFLQIIDYNNKATSSQISISESVKILVIISNQFSFYTEDKAPVIQIHV